MKSDRALKSGLIKVAKHHLRVIETATGISGPFAGRLLASLGAHVVKVEPADGDPARIQPVDDTMAAPSSAATPSKTPDSMVGPSYPRSPSLFAIPLGDMNYELPGPQKRRHDIAESRFPRKYSQF